MSIQWWDDPMRVIQYNMQIMDAAKMDPEQTAIDLENLGANVLVINVGGIYAWYPTKIRYHHINEYMSDDYDFLQSIIEACHKRNIKVIARFDFSKAVDSVYLNKPEWFVQKKNRKPLVYGLERTGNWPLLMSTCINSGYRDKAFAFDAITEVMDGYDIDGFFFNAPQMEKCYCENCNRKYKEFYGISLPDDDKLWEKDWMSRCLKESMDLVYNLIKSKDPSKLVVLYYHAKQSTERFTFTENLDDRFSSCDMVCTEAQNILSAGRTKLAPFYKPMINMKVGHISPEKPNPFGIIHSSPGMDWRHTAIPEAEYAFWMSQIPAAQAYIWHSLTGFNDTIVDKRLLHVVQNVNKRIAQIEESMQAAHLMADVLLLWDGGSSSLGWQEIMIASGIQYNLVDLHHFDVGVLRSHKMLIVPADVKLNGEQKNVLEEYIDHGGNVLFEADEIETIERIQEFFDIRDNFIESDSLKASYMLVRDEAFSGRLGNAQLLPFSGKMIYLNAPEDDMILSLVPPFAPIDGVGAPPERASIQHLETNIPLLLKSNQVSGNVYLLPFSLSDLVYEYGLKDHYSLAYALIEKLCANKLSIKVDAPYGTIFTLYKCDQHTYLIHMINGVGQRPLQDLIPLSDIKINLPLAEQQDVKLVDTYFGGEVEYFKKDDKLSITINNADFWEVIRVELKQEI